jgi:cardiolipin hydrolase
MIFFFRVLLKSIQKAKSSVMCCLFVVTCREMADLLIYARKERKISVYILTDEEMARLPTSLMGELSDAGVSIKVMRSNVMLHHHFVIVDSRVLFNGSFNWTRQAVGFNFETMFITNDPALVLPYRNQ